MHWTDEREEEEEEEEEGRDLLTHRVTVDNEPWSCSPSVAS